LFWLSDECHPRRTHRRRGRSTWGRHPSLQPGPVVRLGHLCPARRPCPVVPEVLPVPCRLAFQHHRPVQVGQLALVVQPGRVRLRVLALQALDWSLELAFRPRLEVRPVRAFRLGLAVQVVPVDRGRRPCPVGQVVQAAQVHQAGLAVRRLPSGQPGTPCTVVEWRPRRVLAGDRGIREHRVIRACQAFRSCQVFPGVRDRRGGSSQHTLQPDACTGSSCR